MEPYQYQSLESKNVFYELLKKKCPWIKDYTFKLYDINAFNDWIYLKNPENKNGYAEALLYVPFSALMEKDANKIIETHLNYWHGYNIKYDEQAQNFVNSEFVQNFLKKVVQ